ncbi:unnamed protein product [Calypogeia fissa]
MDIDKNVRDFIPNPGPRADLQVYTRVGPKDRPLARRARPKITGQGHALRGHHSHARGMPSAARYETSVASGPTASVSLSGISRHVEFHGMSRPDLVDQNRRSQSAPTSLSALQPFDRLAGRAVDENDAPSGAVPVTGKSGTVSLPGRDGNTSEQ